MLENFWQPTGSRSGLICSVFTLRNVKYTDFVKLFGKHHNIDRDDDTYSWLFMLYNGNKVEIRFSIRDYVLDRMHRLELARHPAAPIEDVDILSVMSGKEDAETVISVLLGLFNGSDYEKKLNKHAMIIRVIRNEKDIF